MERQLGAIRAERGQLSRTAESVTNPLSAGINEAEESAHERYANAIKLVEEELAVMKKLAATSLWWVDYTAKILFTLQLIFNENSTVFVCPVVIDFCGDLHRFLVSDLERP